MNNGKRICVFCGSSVGRDPRYRQAAGDLGRLLAVRGYGLVYGGATVGLMGEAADAALAAGGEVIGVIPRALQAREISHPGLTELHVVDSMHERKALMAELSSGFIALPGGMGTFEEFFEIVTWAQLGLHAKPFGLLNVGDYYGGLAAFLDHAAAEGFVNPRHRATILMEAEPSLLLERMESSHPSRLEQVIGPDET